MAEKITARISQLSGQVEIRSTSKDAAKSAQINAPVVPKNVITTSAAGQAEIQIGGNSFRLEPDSELEIIQVTQSNLKLKLNYGLVNLNLADIGLLPQFELRTGTGRLVVSQSSQLSVDFSPPPGATAVRMLSGNANFEYSGDNYTLEANTQLLLRGDIPRISPLTQNSSEQRQPESVRVVQRSVRNVGPEITYIQEQRPTVIRSFEPQYIYRTQTIVQNRFYPRVDPFFAVTPFFIGASFGFNNRRFRHDPFYNRGFKNHRFDRRSFVGPIDPRSVGPRRGGR
jgi:hypothetical protein